MIFQHICMKVRETMFLTGVNSRVCVCVCVCVCVLRLACEVRAQAKDTFFGLVFVANVMGFQDSSRESLVKSLPLQY